MTSSLAELRAVPGLEDYLDALEERLAQIAPESLMTSLELISTGKAPRIPQDNTRVTYAPRLNREAGRIDWTEPAEVIERKIRAYHSWPGAFTMVTGKSVTSRNLKIFSASIFDQHPDPGTIIQADQHGLVVAAGNRALSLREVQLEGKRRMSAVEFVRGYPGLTIAPS